MQLLQFEVHGFKSLYDCKLTDLQSINVFHGENNVGKSNLLEAMELFFRVLSLFDEQGASSSHSFSGSAFQRQFGLVEDIFSWDGTRTTTLRGRMLLSDSDFHQVHLERYAHRISQLEIVLRIAQRRGAIEVRLTELETEEGTVLSKRDRNKREPAEALIREFLSKFGFYRIRFDRRLTTESAPTGARPSKIVPLDPSGSNLKERLFWASVSDDPLERRAFRQVLRPMFANSPLSLGTLQPVARPGAPFDLQLETAERSIPIDQLGSGIQQLALLGGMIALSQCWIVAIEEPEINLSWPTQKKLKGILSNMVADTDVAPSQFFISSHSPLFEFHKNFFKVEMVEGRTVVTPAPNKEREKLFDVFTVPEGRGTMIRSGNAVVLPDYVLETLGVSQGEAIYFHRDGNRFQVLSGAQYEELLGPGEDEQ
jgi:predicted ATPase